MLCIAPADAGGDDNAGEEEPAAPKGKVCVLVKSETDKGDCFNEPECKKECETKQREQCTTVQEKKCDVSILVCWISRKIELLLMGFQRLVQMPMLPERLLTCQY